MCRFKSGIILKNKVVVAPGENDSHSDLLESLGINDDYFGATNVFVRAELVPANDEWWIDPAEEPDKWRFVVDQDMRPEWFDESEHEKIFREAVCGSQVVKMWGRSTARDFKNWPNVKIWVSPEGTFEMVAHQNKSEE